MEIEREKKKMAKNALVADSPVMVAPYAPIFPQHALNTYFIWCPFVCAPVIFFSVSLVHYSSLSFPVYLWLLCSFGHSANLSSQMLLVVTGIIIAYTNYFPRISILSHNLYSHFLSFHLRCERFYFQPFVFGGLVHCKHASAPGVPLLFYIGCCHWNATIRILILFWFII